MDIQKRIQFAKVQTALPWLDFLAENFLLQSEESLRLRDFGALYINQRRWFPEGGTHVQPGDLLRVHLQPRRFPLHLLTEGSAHLEESKDWILLWKPSGLPSHETLDNILENSKAWVEKQVSQKLWSLSRLDVGTRGWLLFAKNANFARDFHIELEQRRVQKFYAALSPPLAESRLGLWRHWMTKSDRSPRDLSREMQNFNDLICELEILEMSQQGPWMQSRLMLLTGRTHQIRAQFAFEGAPLLGDTMYGSKVCSEKSYDSFALSCERLAFQDRGHDRQFRRPANIKELSEEWL